MPFRLHELNHDSRYLIEELLPTGWEAVALAERDGAKGLVIYSMKRLDEPLMSGFSTPDEVLDAYADWIEQHAAAADPG